jgi:hypothetical protein
MIFQVLLGLRIYEYKELFLGSPNGHQLIIMTTLHSMVRGNVGATLVSTLSEVEGWSPVKPVREGTSPSPT